MHNNCFERHLKEKNIPRRGWVKKIPAGTTTTTTTIYPLIKKTAFILKK